MIQAGICSTSRVSRVFFSCILIVGFSFSFGEPCNTGAAVNISNKRYALLMAGWARSALQQDRLSFYHSSLSGRPLGMCPHKMPDAGLENSASCQKREECNWLNKARLGFSSPSLPP